MKKECRYCKELFESGHNVQHYCTVTCRGKDRMQKINSRWAKTDVKDSTQTNAHPWKTGFSIQN